MCGFDCEVGFTSGEGGELDGGATGAGAEGKEREVAWRVI